MARELSPDKREKFLSSALKLFVANGIQHTSTAEISKDAGTAAGTLFLYFPTKQALVDQLALKVCKEQSDYINGLLNPSYSAREMFSAIWRGSLHWFLANMEAYQFNQQIRDSVFIADDVVEETRKSLAYYFTAVQKGLEESSLKPYSAEVIGSFLYQDIVAVMNLICMQPDPAQYEALIQAGFDIFWDGIKA